MRLRDAHALVIGVSAYRRVRPLPRTFDAEDVADCLRSPDCGAYPPGQVRTLLEGEATKSNLLEALDELAARTPEDSTALVYFSGHGGRAAGHDGDDEDESGECYLLPVEAAGEGGRALAATALSAAELGARLRAIKAARLTVVLDCCRAGGVADAKSAKDVKPPAVDGVLPARAISPLSRGRGRAVLAGSRADGYAFVRPGERNGVFTRHLLAGLRGAAGGAGGVVRVCDLFHYVQQNVSAETDGQRPVFKAELEENYPLALYRGGAAPAFELPPPPDDLPYDAFVSYRRRGPERAWVEGRLVPRLAQLGARVCLERDFCLGAPRVREMERAIVESRYTLAVLSPAYLDGAFQDFEAWLAQHQAVELKAPRFIPLMRENCTPRLSIRAAEWLDMGDDDEFEANIAHLARRLRQSPRPPRGA